MWRGTLTSRSTCTRMARTMGNCPECGLNLGLVGVRHVCRPSPAVPEGLGAAVSPTPATNGTNGTNEPAPDGTNTERDRKRRWRAAHPDKYREYQRAYMAKRRAVLAPR